MAGFKLPKQSSLETLIDLTEFGGEGFLSVHQITTGDSWALNEYVRKLAKEDGFKCETDDDLSRLSSGVYKFQTLTFMITRLTYGVGPDGQEPLNEDDVLSLPPELIAKIITTIEEGANFPLAQKGGTAQK